MRYHKITTGFVIQVFDTEKNAYVSQHFVAGDTVDYERANGDRLNLKQLGDAGFGPYSEIEPYLQFDMVQPNTKRQDRRKDRSKDRRKAGQHRFADCGGHPRCVTCGRDEDDAFIGGETCSFGR